MGASANEIDREISETRAGLDEKLNVLEKRAASGARRLGIMAAIGLAAGLAVAGAAFLVYRRVRRPSLTDRLQDFLPDALTGLPDEVRSRLRSGPIKVVITQGDEDAEPGTWESTGRKVAPTLVSTALGGVMSRLLGRTPEPGS
ncbi:MAG: hypothetical protein E6J12_12225, partial [Chloroflexi bacterium]